CDLCILATPLYHYTVNAQMKTFIERTLPIAQPFFEKRDGVTRHPLRHAPPPTVVISVAGFPEESVFDQLKSYVNYLYRNLVVAEIYRSSAELLRKSPANKAMKDILEATIQGGRELAESMKIFPETMARIKQPLTSFESMAPLGNLMWQTCIDEGVTPAEFQKKGMVPRPNSIETFMAVMKIGFNPEKAADTKVTMRERGRFVLFYH
ncbi:MAG: flavodoxin family protein, partial [Deltaproteobacteria bacterium]|nr:flavodoxin family protein [Deltaproteobacteria bacterium]